MVVERAIDLELHSLGDLDGAGAASGARVLKAIRVLKIVRGFEAVYKYAVGGDSRKIGRADLDTDRGMNET